MLQFIRNSREVFYIYRVHCVGIQMPHIADTVEHLETEDKTAVDIIWFFGGCRDYINMENSENVPKTKGGS